MRNKMKVSCIIVLVCLSLLPVGSVFGSTAITTYGVVVSVTSVYGSTGLVNSIQIVMDNLDTTGEFMYVCRRPNLGPCVNAMIGNSYMFQANMTQFCSVSGKLCGEGTVSSIAPLPFVIDSLP